MDACGGGTLKIIDVCKEAGLPKPDMKEIYGGFSERNLELMRLFYLSHTISQTSSAKSFSLKNIFKSQSELSKEFPLP